MRALPPHMCRPRPPLPLRRQTHTGTTALWTTRGITSRSSPQRRPPPPRRARARWARRAGRRSPCAASATSRPCAEEKALEAPEATTRPSGPLDPAVGVTPQTQRKNENTHTTADMGGVSPAQNKTHRATRRTTGNVLFLDVKQTASARMAMFLFYETNTRKKSAVQQKKHRGLVLCRIGDTHSKKMNYTQ